MFLPKEKNFFDLYEKLAEKIKESVEYLEQLTKDYSTLPQVAQKLNNLEDEADSIVHQIVEELLYDHTRVTEEKGDIRFLVHNMDNVIDSIEKAVNRLYIYRVKNIPQALYDFLPYLKEAANQIEIGVKSLRNIRKNDKILAECCVRINDLEDEADEINRKWLAKIVGTNFSSIEDFKKTLAIKEIIDLLEYAMDQCEDVANILETFRLKGEA
ncbi:DUF47 family protein [bacterium]|nr:DUF47 family protein [bacterium]